MQQLNELVAIESECNRVVNGMLDGSMTRDDGLFASAVALQKIAHELSQFVSYALPILHTIDQAMRTAAAQAQAAQAQAPQAQAQAAQAQAPQAQAQARAAQAAQAQQNTPPTNVVPINAVPDDSIQSVDATVMVRP